MTEISEDIDVAALRAGEDDTPPDPGTQLTPGQWIYRWNRLTAQQRLTKVEGLFHMLDVGHQCFLQGHDGLREELDVTNRRIESLMLGSLAERYAVKLEAVRRRAHQWAALSGSEFDADAAVSEPQRLVAWQLAECGRAVLAILDQEAS